LETKLVAQARVTNNRPIALAADLEQSKVKSRTQQDIQEKV